ATLHRAIVVVFTVCRLGVDTRPTLVWLGMRITQCTLLQLFFHCPSRQPDHDTLTGYRGFLGVSRLRCLDQPTNPAHKRTNGEALTRRSFIAGATRRKRA